ncbi:transferase hexapeptide (six repeat-containing protein) [Paenibacillus tianmuensis]|uniref:Transferase hexapeptide (Six repeat-containing protein) n=1 Tax=Paenibacillus tianmuensis TaxID=624147 RepID=A0A1G4RPD3_9BACL|nr:acyltransferase [Paenibacillus tianmuensis]SCW58688.1 transferase hexapeptide (six repeat-containing protein) [Paenibacillus tianmuensis]
MLIISEKANISRMADIEPSVRGTRIVVEEGVMIDSFVKIKCVGGTGDIYIGKNTYINSCCVLYSGNGLTIGQDVLIAANCTFAPVNHEYRSKDKIIKEQRFMPSRGGIIIEDDVWIGANCVLLDGATVRKGCVVGANSLVKGELEPYSVYVGSPCQKVGVRK